MREAFAGRDRARLGQLEYVAQTSTTAANRPMKAKIACQPNAVSSAPPISGAIIGATTIAMVTQPIIEAARSRS